jgi:D-beta-D-heptose 7-phosphate kinase/D-beta-D-heptose 1-phosphate adenosyltransferase
MTAISVPRAQKLLKAMRGRRVMVLGDVMLDEFLWGDVSRISPEAPVPVVEVKRQTFHLGGAGNVASNVRSLGGRAFLTGVIGKDVAGDKLRGAVVEAGIDDLLVPADRERPTTVKTRIIAHHQQVVRADREQSDEISAPLEDAVLSRARQALPECSALILSDYQKGVLTPRVMKAVLTGARKRRIPVLVDPKVRHFTRYRGVSIVTPNHLEAEQATGIRIRSAGDLEAAGRKILRLLKCEAVLVTRGEQGMTLFQQRLPPLHIPAAAREVFDVTGAGDTVIAALGLACAAGATFEEAARLANHAAGVVVGKLGTAAALPGEILEAVKATRGSTAVARTKSRR